MIVGICHTKSEAGAIAWTKAFKAGVELHGDQTVSIKNSGDLSRLAGCDVSFQVCEECFTSFPENTLRRNIGLTQKNNGRPRIILDVGFIKNTREHSLEAQHMSIGINSVKREGSLHTSNSPSDRWSKLDIDQPRWRTDGNHILVIGQTEHGIGTQSIRRRGMSFLDWSNKTLKSIREYTNRNIIYKPHPGQQRLPSPVERCTLLPLGKKSKISEYLPDCWCAVAAASNGAADCVINGIPVITNDPMSIAYDISSHRISEIETPNTPDLTQWLYNTAYAQWNIKEMQSGEVWLYIKNHLTGGADGT